MKMSNNSMVMDLYELTMSNSYFLCEEARNTKAVFDVFYRKNPNDGGYAVFAGLEQIIEYIENLRFSSEDIEYLKSLNMFDDGFLEYLANFKFKGDIKAVPEGTIVYPNIPLITVTAPLIDAQLIETEILLQVNHQSLIATKANRIIRSARGRGVADFGARRAHNNDAAIYGARAAYIGGVGSTATVKAGQMFNISVTGTMAHSYIMFFENEYEAFKKYAQDYPDNCCFLLDTYDVIKSGVPNAIRVNNEILKPQGKTVKSVRLDSGDLAYLSKKVRKMLDDAGMKDTKIIASNSLDEYTIESLITKQDAKIDAFGVGERLITSKSEPVFGGVYKIAAIIDKDKVIPKIKISENVEKITTPCLKNLYRIYDETGFAIADLLACNNEDIDMSKPYRYIDPKKPWKQRYFENCKAVNLHKDIFKDGKLVYKCPNVNEIRDYVKYQLEKNIWQEEQRFENPHEHYIDFTPDLYEIKMNLLEKLRNEN